MQAMIDIFVFIFADDVNVLQKDTKPGKTVESKILSPLPGRSPPPTVKGMMAPRGPVQPGGPPGTLPKAKHCYAGLPKHHTFMVKDELYGSTLPTYPSSATMSMTRAKIAQQIPFRSQSFNGTADPRNYKDSRPLKNRVTFLDQRNKQLQNGLTTNPSGRGRPVKLCVTVMNEDDSHGSGSETDVITQDNEDRSRLLCRGLNGNSKVAHDNKFSHDKMNYSSDWTNDEDDATTTSGSYVVDPEELGIEIEAALANMDARSSNV